MRWKYCSYSHSNEGQIEIYYKYYQRLMQKITISYSICWQWSCFNTFLTWYTIFTEAVNILSNDITWHVCDKMVMRLGRKRVRISCISLLSYSYMMTNTKHINFLHLVITHAEEKSVPIYLSMLPGKTSMVPKFQYD